MEGQMLNRIHSVTVCPFLRIERDGKPAKVYGMPWGTLPGLYALRGFLREMSLDDGPHDVAIFLRGEVKFFL